jgi:hypothetical protein
MILDNITLDQWGCLPCSLDKLQSTDKYGCEASQFFNQKIKEAVVQLRKDLPQAAITCLDVYLL